MTERANQTATPTPSVPSEDLPVEPPVEIDDAAIEALLELEPETTSPEVSSSTPLTPTREETPSEEGTVTQTQLLSLLPQIIQAARSQPDQTPAQQRKSALEFFTERFPNADPEGLKPIAEAFAGYLQDQMLPYQQQLQQLTQAITQQNNANTLQSYEGEMTKAMEKEGIAEEDYQEVLDHINAWGLREQSQGRGQFTVQKAKKKLGELAAKRRQANHATQRQYVNRKKEQREEAAPVSHGAQTTTAVESIQKGLENIQDHSFDFDGPNFNKLVRGLTKQAGRLAKSALG